MTRALEFTFYGKMKSGKNGIKIHPVTGVHYPTPQFKVWRANIIRQINAQHAAVPIFPKRTPLQITIRYWPGDLIVRDATGVMDALWHVFEHMKMVKNDGLIQQVDYQQMPLDRVNPRCYVKLETIDAPLDEEGRPCRQG